MPIYCFCNEETGETKEVFASMDDIPSTVALPDGSVATRDRFAENVGIPSKSGWPITCLASGVNASQAQELRDEFKRVGVPTSVTDDGDPVYNSPGHRRRALKARGLHDRNSFM